MLTILWLLFIAVATSIVIVWVLDHHGYVVINWLGYEVKTDILSAIILAVVITLLIFFISYIATRILAIKFPQLLKTFFKRNYIKRLEKIIIRNQQSNQIIAQLLLALELKDFRLAENLQKKLQKLNKNLQLNNFLTGKIAYENEEYVKASKHFANFEDNKFAKILFLKSKLKFSLEKKDDVSAIAYAKQILLIKKDDAEALKLIKPDS